MGPRPSLTRVPWFYSSYTRATMKARQLPCDSLGAIKLHDITRAGRRLDFPAPSLFSRALQSWKEVFVGGERPASGGHAPVPASPQRDLWGCPRHQAGTLHHRGPTPEVQWVITPPPSLRVAHLVHPAPQGRHPGRGAPPQSLLCISFRIISFLPDKTGHAAKLGK